MFNTPSRASTPRRTGPRQSSLRSSRAGTPSSAFAGAGPSRQDAFARAASPALSTSSSLAPATRRKSHVSSRSRRPQSDYGQASDATPGQDASGDEITTGPTAQTSLQPGHLLRRDDFSAVTVFSALPRQVIAALEASDPYIDASTGHLDEHTGYGVLATTKTCYVWSFANRKAAYATSYSFPSSPDSSSTTAVHALPHVVLVPRSSAREPGLLIASRDGHIRFFDSVTASFTGGQDRSQHLDIAVGVKETVVGLTRCDERTYVLSTSQSRLFRITVASSGGRLQAHLTPFSQSRGIFGRLFGASGSSSVTGFTSEGIVSVVPCPSASTAQGSTDVFVVGHRMLQKWRLADGGSERLLGEQDVGRTIANSVAASPDEVANLADSIGLEIIDAASRQDGSVFILYSYVKHHNKPLAFGVAVVASTSDGGSFVLVSNDLLNYTALRDPRPYSSPRLVAPNGGPAVFVAFADSLVIALAAESGIERFEERITLKDGARNRFLGFGSESADVAAANPSVTAVSCLSAQSGSLLVEFSIEAARRFTQRLSEPADRQAALNERLQNQLEQAVFFDDQSSGGLNPLSFAISTQPPVQGDLEAVAERVSSEIVSSTSRYLATYVDLREHLTDRLTRSIALIEVINEDHLLSLLSHSSRSKLCSDAQLLSAGVDLWRLHNSQMGQSVFDSSTAPSSLLADAIEDIMAGTGQSLGQDTVRMFFRSHLSGIVAVFENLQGRLRAASSERADIKANAIAELNRIALTAFGSAIRYREACARQYALEKRTSAESWTCRPVSLQLLESLFVATEQLIHDRRRDLGSQVDSETAQSRDASHLFEFNLQKELKTNLCELARCALTAYEERISYLSSVASAADGPLERELSATESKYATLRPRLLRPLVAIGRADRALQLAERHQDFRTLTELCLDPSTGDADSLIQHYMRRYGQAFGFELFGYYSETGQLKKLLSPLTEWNGLLDEYLKTTENARISWLHDLKLKKYHSASETLLSEATVERGELKTKKVLLSLGKLSYLAELSEEQVGSQVEQDRIETIDDQLDLIGIHDKVKRDLGAVIEEQTGGTGVRRDREVELIVDALLSAHGEAYTAHYARLSRHLLSGHVLCSEDLIDLLTLKDGSPSEDYVLSLEVCLRATDLQQSRLQAILCSIWRRCLLSDDWHAIVNTRDATDEEMQSRLESSAWYQTLLAAYSGAGGDENDRGAMRGFVLSMDDIASVPSREVVRARLEMSAGEKDGWEEMQMDTQTMEERVESMLGDIEIEVERIRELVEESAQTGQWIQEAKRRAEAQAIAM